MSPRATEIAEAAFALLSLDLQASVRRLEEEGQVLVLLRAAGLTYPEMGELVGLGYKTVERRLADHLAELKL